MTTLTLSDLIAGTLENQPLWSPGYKIPWNSPEFSRRMLREHLSQDHDLASRRQAAIERQGRWLRERFLGTEPGRILDLGCGPGLYSPCFSGHGHRYLGIDFSPASIAHAREHFTAPGCEFILGDILDTPYQGPHDLALMLYGEFNVFPEQDALRLLAKAHESLAPGGTLVLEAHTWDAARALGSSPASWTPSAAGLFSGKPHVCLSKSQWFSEENTARQLFYVVDAKTASIEAMCSTTRAWTDAEYEQFLVLAGFTEVRIETGWPQGREEFVTLSARKP